MAREGPMNRCQICGQCFKIVRLKDEFSAEQDYYSMMFAQISQYEYSEDDLQVSITSTYNDRPNAQQQTIPGTHVYLLVNSDESDRILVDPAYRLEKYAEMNEKLFAMHTAFHHIGKMVDEKEYRVKKPIERSLYENWHAMELSMRKFDRIFNRVEKFDARKFNDPENHERREQRMLEKMRYRNVQNYTFFTGRLTEEEQQYRDYFESDLEVDPEDSELEEEMDRSILSNHPDMNPNIWDFCDMYRQGEIHENNEDIIEDKIFKYKYRINADHVDTYERRSVRQAMRWRERMEHRDPSIHADLVDRYQRDWKDSSLGQIMLDTESVQQTGELESRSYREYMAREGVQ